MIDNINVHPSILFIAVLSTIISFLKLVRSCLVLKILEFAYKTNFEFQLTLFLIEKTKN
jgi:hypothetical protein